MLRKVLLRFRKKKTKLEINKKKIYGLEYGPEYQEFTKEVQSFFVKNMKGYLSQMVLIIHWEVQEDLVDLKCLGLNGKKP